MTEEIFDLREICNLLYGRHLKMGFADNYIGGQVRFLQGLLLFLKGGITMKGKFELGQIVATAAIDERIKADDQFFVFVLRSIARHAVCDWGDMCEEDKALNDQAIIPGRQAGLHSSYTYSGEDGAQTKIWIITERDRSATTILFPEDY